ncbi:MAG TPA: group III truncated hemoglobin, partial [Anseongella sp.]|nr:group III truncated hemoglobin [Anseongella sp.]
MKKRGDIRSMDDIKELVDIFYHKVRWDELLGPVFKEKIQDNWPRHLATMYRFWGTVLLDERSYFGSPFLKHAGLPVEGPHFQRWLNYFYETLDELFEGPKTAEAKFRAEKMAEMFQVKLEHIRKTGNL